MSVDTALFINGGTVLFNYNPATSDQQKLTDPCGKSQPWKANWQATNLAQKKDTTFGNITYSADAEGSAVIDGLVLLINFNPATGDEKPLADLLSKDEKSTDGKNDHVKKLEEKQEPGGGSA